MLVWIDLEMTGLDPKRHVIVEIATIVTDDELNIVAEGPDLVVSATASQLAEMDDVVQKMHSESGLLEEIEKSTLSLAAAGEATLEFIRANLPDPSRVPLCGNSIGMDRLFLRHQLPEIEQALHYRCIDVSTIKELCKRWQPAIYGKAPRKAGAHRALGDIRESVAELAYYRENLMIPTGSRKPADTSNVANPQGSDSPPAS